MKALQLIMIAAVALFGFVSIARTQPVLAQGPGPCDKNGDGKCTPEETSCDQLQQFDPDACAQTGEAPFVKVARQIANIFLFVIGLASVLAVIIGGLLYTTSGGDPGRAARAKNTILYAVIGIVVSAASYALVIFVFDSFEN